MPQPKKAAAVKAAAEARAKGDAARAEANGEAPGPFEWRGLTLTPVAEKLPFRILSFADTEHTGLGDLLAVLRDILGEDQMRQVWAADIGLDDSAEAIDELFRAAMAVYGVTPGESPASPTP